MTNANCAWQIKRRITDAQATEAVRLCQSGMSYAEIAAAMGCSKSQAKRRVEKGGLKRPFQPAWAPPAHSRLGFEPLTPRSKITLPRLRSMEEPNADQEHEREEVVDSYLSKIGALGAEAGHKCYAAQWVNSAEDRLYLIRRIEEHVKQDYECVLELRDMLNEKSEGNA